MEKGKKVLIFLELAFWEEGRCADLPLYFVRAMAEGCAAPGCMKEWHPAQLLKGGDCEGLEGKGTLESLVSLRAGACGLIPGSRNHTCKGKKARKSSCLGSQVHGSGFAEA